MKVEGISPQFMLEAVFLPVPEQCGRSPPEKGGSSVPVQRFWLILRKPELREEEEKKHAIVIPDEETVADYWEYRRQLDEMSADFKRRDYPPQLLSFFPATW